MVASEVERNQALQDSERRVRLLEMAETMSGIGHWHYELSSGSVTWSDEVYRIHGLDRKSFTPGLDNVVAAYHPEDRARLGKCIDQAIAHQKDYTFELRIVRSDGAIRTVRSTARCEVAEEGSTAALFGLLEDVTERRALEEHILKARDVARETARRAELAERTAGLGHWRLEPDTGALTWSDQMYEIYGLPRDHPLELGSLMAMTHPEDRDGANEKLAREIQTGKTTDGDVVRIVRADGTLRYVKGRSAVDTGPGGRVLALVGTVMDVTSLQTALLERERSEERFRRLTENANDIVTEADLSGRFTYVSPAVTSITGFEPAEVLGRFALDLVYPDDRERVRQEIGACLADGSGRHIEHRCLTKDGRVIWVESRPTLARDPVTAKAFAVTDVMRDITARTEAAAALCESEARYRLLADNASDMIAESTMDGVVTYISPGCQNILGFKPDQIVGRNTSEFIHPHDVDVISSYYEQLTALGDGGRLEPLQYRARHSDGHWVWLEGLPRLFFDQESGKAVTQQDSVRDVTSRKELEVQLQTALETAEDATRVKSEFLSNMSHELRTPLTSILGFSSILNDEQGMSELGRRAVDRVSGSSLALLTIVNDILDFSRLESGQVEIDRRAAAPRAVLRDALGLLEPQADAKALMLTIRGADALPVSVLMDDGRVRQILLNLVGNAVKFTDAGGVELSVCYDTATGRLRCEVNDTGPGIPPDRLDRLFKRFSQVDASTTRAFGGTGLGLAICKGLVEAMGGEIGVASELGKGACFWFDLPCPIAETLADCATGEFDRGGLDGLRLLLADDNANNRELVRVMLEPHGVEIVDVEDGAAAVESANQAPFDVILMDVRMPELDGPTAARRIRQGGGPNDLTPILAFTANDADDAVLAGALGVFDGHVGKPISPSELVSAMVKWGSPFEASPDVPAYG